MGRGTRKHKPQTSYTSRFFCCILPPKGSYKSPSNSNKHYCDVWQTAARNVTKAMRWVVWDVWLRLRVAVFVPDIPIPTHSYVFIHIEWLKLSLTLSITRREQGEGSDILTCSTQFSYYVKGKLITPDTLLMVVSLGAVEAAVIVVVMVIVMVVMVQDGQAALMTQNIGIEGVLTTNIGVVT